MLSRQAKAYLLALLTVGFWSTVASASKLSLVLISPAELLLYSSIVSTAVLFVILALQKRLTLLAQLSLKDWLVSMAFGFLNPFAYYLVLFQAYNLLPAQQAQIINYTWAITLTLLSIPLLGQRVSRMQWLAIGISYCGVLVIATRGRIMELQFENPVGVPLPCSQQLSGRSTGSLTHGTDGIRWPGCWQILSVQCR
jgi:drug/metabolite transporter (DMT)-like permease